jgi:6-phosphogluconolactonase
MNLHTYPDPVVAAEACAGYIAAKLAGALAVRGYATLAISGGNSPKPMFARLVSAELPWDRLHVFWVDERAVPPDDPESNYLLAHETLLSKVPIPATNVHRIRAELVPEEAARDYEREIRGFFRLGHGQMPVFDLVHRGMGPDAHTASLFPGEPLIEDRAGLVAAVYVEKKNQWRITLLPGPLLAARETVMLVTGGDKSESLRAVLEGPVDPVHWPAQLMPHGEPTAWFLDEPAALLLAKA